MNNNATTMEAPTQGQKIEPLCVMESAVYDDVPAIAELIERTYGSTGYAEVVPFDSTSVMTRLAMMIGGGDIVLVLRCGEKMIGVCGAGVWRAFANMDVNIAAATTWIDPAYEQSDAQAQLLRRCEQVAASRGCSLVLYTKPAQSDGCCGDTGFSPMECIVGKAVG